MTKIVNNENLAKYLSKIVRPKPDSRKGENGRVLVIGGSKLFHAASFWAAAAASKIVDMVHFSSPTLENNELMRVRAKAKFWEGIVIPWEEVVHYIEEDDCILIGPGMERGEDTSKIVNGLLSQYPEKKWVVDGGALQEMDVRLLNKNMIITPNEKEIGILGNKFLIYNSEFQINDLIIKITNKLSCTILAKGKVDKVVSGGQVVEITGGNAGMTKGGTGDVLAGIVAGLYAKSPAAASCVVASYVNKRVGEKLAKKVGVYFGAGDLITEVQKVIGAVLTT